MCQGGKPDTGKFHLSCVGMNVCGFNFLKNLLFSSLNISESLLR